MESNPLNPYLYKRLEALFGPVGYINRGQELVGKVIFNSHRDRFEFKTYLPGEYYRVNCPFCSDTKRRLYVGYKFGQRDEKDRPMTYFAVCYNDTACMSEIDNRHALVDKLQGKIKGRLEEAELRRGKRSARLTTVQQPGKVAPLNSLSFSHRAYAYMESRGFNINTLTDFYDFGYCTRSPEPLADKRIFAPIYFKNKFVSWQCRLPEDLPSHVKWPPKYFTMPGTPKQFILYNYDNAIKWNTGVIVEGVLDAVGFGPQAMAVLGNRVSEFQTRLLNDAFEGKKLLVLLDPKEMNKDYTLHKIGEFRRALGKRNVAAVTLPEGSDPGSLDRAFMREFVQKKALKQGVRLDFSASKPGLKG